MTVRDMAACARQAAWEMAVLPDALRRRALLQMAGALEAEATRIFEANARDMARAAEEGLAAPLAKRLRFDGAKLADACAGLRALAALPDPLGRTQLATELAEGLELYRVSCPIGVIGVIFESRPDALVQIAALCARSGNAALLKGGREALETNRTLFSVMDGAARGAGLPAGWAALLETREDVGEMLALDDWIDLIIPRGSNAFVRYIMDHSRIPVLGHADGICHVYVDKDADLDMALRVAVDSKTQNVSVCNAMETLLVHRDVAEAFLPSLAQAMGAKGVQLRGDEATRALIACDPATEADWDTEYLDLILSIRVVDSLEAAIDHINRHGSHHTDCIVTGNDAAAAEFLQRVDSAGVYRNVSTRFADGFVYGFGAEVGIATGKIHARGPMGLEGLTTYKYKLLGDGQLLAEMKDGTRHYTHRDLDQSCPL